MLNNNCDSPKAINLVMTVISKTCDFFTLVKNCLITFTTDTVIAVLRRKILYSKIGVCKNSLSEMLNAFFLIRRANKIC